MSAVPLEMERKLDLTPTKGASPEISTPQPAFKPAAETTQNAVEGAEQASPGCPHCGCQDDWGRASWCPRCGFYPALGTWTEANPHTIDVVPPPKFFLLLVPRWGWILLGGVLATIAFSIAGRLLTHDDGWDRTIWAMSQFLAGALCFFSVHMWIFIAATIRDSRFGMFDFFLKPFAAWMTTIHELPGSRRRLWIGAWSLSTAFWALVIVGGIRYSAVFDDWGIRGPKSKDDVAAAVLKKSRQEKSKGSLEEGVQDLASKVKAEDASKKKEAPKPLNADCVVIGYIEDETGGGFKELVLASMVDNQLQFVGTLSNGIPDDVRADLNRRLPKLAREKPFVRCRLLARWVQPSIMCGVDFKNWNDSRQLAAPVFGKMLPDAL